MFSIVYSRQACSNHRPLYSWPQRASTLLARNTAVCPNCFGFSCLGFGVPGFGSGVWGLAGMQGLGLSMLAVIDFAVSCDVGSQHLMPSRELTSIRTMTMVVLISNEMLLIASMVGQYPCSSPCSSFVAFVGPWHWVVKGGEPLPRLPGSQAAPKLGKASRSPKRTGRRCQKGCDLQSPCSRHRAVLLSPDTPPPTRPLYFTHELALPSLPVLPGCQHRLLQ